MSGQGLGPGAPGWACEVLVDDAPHATRVTKSAAVRKDIWVWRRRTKATRRAAAFIQFALVDFIADLSSEFVLAPTLEERSHGNWRLDQMRGGPCMVRTFIGPHARAIVRTLIDGPRAARSPPQATAYVYPRIHPSRKLMCA